MSISRRDNEGGEGEGSSEGVKHSDFLSVHGVIQNFFRLGRHRLRSEQYRSMRERSFGAWSVATATQRRLNHLLYRASEDGLPPIVSSPATYADHIKSLSI